MRHCEVAPKVLTAAIVKNKYPDDHSRGFFVSEVIIIDLQSSKRRNLKQGWNTLKSEQNTYYVCSC